MRRVTAVVRIAPARRAAPSAHRVEGSIQHVRGQSLDDGMRAAEIEDPVVHRQLEARLEGVTVFQGIPEGERAVREVEAQTLPDARNHSLMGT